MVPPSNANDSESGLDPPLEDAVFVERVQRVVSVSIDQLGDPRGALLPILHGLQEEFDYVPPAAVPIVANSLNLTRAEVHGVVSFYQDFRSDKPGHHVLRICQAESCQALGSRALTAKVKAQLGIDFNQTTEDNAFTLEPVYCLGNCALSPSLQIDSEVYGRVTEERLADILASARKTP